MIEEEANRLCASVLALWPRSAWPDVTVAIAKRMFAQIEYVHAAKAVANIAKAGREYAPPPGVIFRAAEVIEEESRPRLPEPETTSEDWNRSRTQVSKIRKAIEDLAAKKRSSTGGRPS